MNYTCVISWNGCKAWDLCDESVVSEKAALVSTGCTKPPGHQIREASPRAERPPRTPRPAHRRDAVDGRRPRSVDGPVGQCRPGPGVPVPVPGREGQECGHLDQWQDRQPRRAVRVGERPPGPGAGPGRRSGRGLQRCPLRARPALGRDGRGQEARSTGPGDRGRCRSAGAPLRRQRLPAGRQPRRAGGLPVEHRAAGPDGPGHRARGRERCPRAEPPEGRRGFDRRGHHAHAGSTGRGRPGQGRQGRRVGAQRRPVAGRPGAGGGCPDPAAADRPDGPAGHPAQDLGHVGEAAPGRSGRRRRRPCCRRRGRPSGPARRRPRRAARTAAAKGRRRPGRRRGRPPEGRCRGCRGRRRAEPHPAHAQAPAAGPAAPPPSTNGGVSAVLAYARAQIGKPYQWGAPARTASTAPA